MSGRRGDQTKLQITAGATLGSRQLTLAAPKDLQAGQLICIYLKNNDMGQIVRLTKVTGDTVTLEQPLRFTCGPAANLGLRKLTPVTGVGIEDLHVRREDQSECSIIGFYCAENCWVRGCETEFCMKYHIQASLSRYVTIENCYVHHAHHQGGAGHGYGVELDDWTADCLVQNNLFHTLRHAMVVQNGANGCVFAYNYSFDTFGSGDTGPPLYHSAPPWFHSGDIENHGGYAYADLYEGNVAEMADVGCLGPAGPRNTLFRNRIAAPEKAYDLEHYKKLGGTHTFYLSIVIVADTKETNVIGNTITEDARATMKTIIDRASRDDTLVEGNLVDGKMQWNKAQPAPLPASLFLTAKPAFWGEKPWPGIGADADRQTMSTLPAQDWHAAHQTGRAFGAFRQPCTRGVELKGIGVRS